MEFNNSEPIYLQVIRMMKKDIVRGRLKPGEKLPSTRELSLNYQINPNTAGRIYREMELMGLCGTKRGIGTFVSEDPAVYERLHSEMAEEAVTKYIKDMKDLGYRQEEALRLVAEKWKEQEHVTGMQ